MSLTVLQNSGILERLGQLVDRLERRDVLSVVSHDAESVREAIALLKASREALGGLFGELMNPDVVIARIPLSDEPLDRAAAVMKALDDGGEAVHTGRLWDEP